MLGLLTKKVRTTSLGFFIANILKLSIPINLYYSSKTFQSNVKTYLTEKIAREMSKDAKEMMDKYMLRLAKILLLTAELLVVF